MSTDTITHRKLIRILTAIGPYLRELKSSESQYFFDCLAVCVSAKAEPSEREFWGWWLTLDNQDGQHFEFYYQFGFFDVEGEWQARTLPKKHQAEVTRTLRDFYVKLEACLENQSLTMNPSAALEKDHVLSIA
ncbi:sigma factor-binding protein Crl [Oceanisphaera pacifica]|uniref:Sigma factor-binding protein Crl n=1 Tax=Oceanisphaera pacifica TaxID=2818389 RepID=A0ABS3ND16_9GAMM|nr:sigma factor-binding protein Crl [Oceanisphaera pacifica]MBO1518471.1 sigma factor-binding protein Crl [Oceanisphaera pacifica]